MSELYGEDGTMLDEPDEGSLEANDDMTFPEAKQLVGAKIGKLIDEGSVKTPAEAGRQYVNRLKNLRREHNYRAPRDERWPSPREPDSVPMARLAFKFHTIRNVTFGESESSGGGTVLTCYIPEPGRHQGIHLSMDDADIRKLALSFNPSPERPKTWIRDFNDELKSMAPVVPITRDKPYWVPVANGIYDTESHKLLPFDKDYVTMWKAATKMPEREPPVPVMPDGWPADALIPSLQPTDEGQQQLWQILAMALMCFRNWGVMPILIGRGSNGKSVFLKLLSNVIGDENTAKVKLEDLGGGFEMSPIVSKPVDIDDDVDVGAFVDKVGPLKTLLRHGAININRKYKEPLSYLPFCLPICASNGDFRFRDHTDSMDDRIVYVPFPNRFQKTPQGDRIDSEYIKRDDVREWFLYKTLTQPKFDALLETKEGLAIKQQQRSESDEVARFWDELRDVLMRRDFLPNSFLYQLFCSFERDANPGSRQGIEKQPVFMRHLRPFIEKDGYIQPRDGSGKGVQLSLDKWLAGSINLESAVSNYGVAPYFLEDDDSARVAKKHHGRSRGFVKQSVWEQFQKDNLTPRDRSDRAELRRAEEREGLNQAGQARLEALLRMSAGGDAPALRPSSKAPASQVPSAPPMMPAQPGGVPATPVMPPSRP
ncbi:phage/plasmid primase, P4 family [Bifidobacterium sp. ESL0728]|uniref:phage/plasmid primase, P4 family n=1 Tax=Bifidobacterium sp. ESL0728 TaxID=2983220 RepID=UPI0023F6C335|nr:phage/plasmid primase, P4 family [Bifidobacterium sp. ESL0728]WEV58972.1 phage/plasmid primase, P4 family [Bifidobacterium sp. ESL0728]